MKRDVDEAGLTQDLDLPFAIPIRWSDGRVRWLGTGDSRLNSTKYGQKNEVVNQLAWRQVQFSKSQQGK